MKTILSICSARPNFVKLAAVHHALAAKGIPVRHVIVHTGQHHDPLFSDVFFKQLGIPLPDINLDIHGGTNAEQQKRVEEACIPVFRREHPDVVLVYGDVNGAAAAARTAHGLEIPVAHVEAGLRSFDSSMPEEHNRIAIDKLSSFLFVTEESGIVNLQREGITKGVHLVGNTMIDTLIRMLPAIGATPLPPGVPERFALVTLHRPGNVDHPATLANIVTFLTELSRRIPVLFPVHLRTKERLREAGLYDRLSPSVTCLEPLPYLAFLRLTMGAQFLLTDSGGIQEETTFLRKKCFTARPNTERPVTITAGSNELVDLGKEEDRRKIFTFASGDQSVTGDIPPLWDGKAGERILDILLAHS